MTKPIKVWRFWYSWEIQSPIKSELESRKDIDYSLKQSPHLRKTVLIDSPSLVLVAIDYGGTPGMWMWVKEK